MKTLTKVVYLKQNLLVGVFPCGRYFIINPFMHNVVKWPNILQKSCGVNTARFLMCVWPFYNIMHERVNQSVTIILISIDIPGASH